MAKSKKKTNSGSPKERRTLKSGRPSSIRTKGPRVTSRRIAAGPFPGGGYFLILSFLLLLAGLLSLPNFHLYLPKDSFWDRLFIHPILILFGFLGMAYSFWKLPDFPDPFPMPKTQAYPWFLFFFGLCFFWRFYRPLEPSADFWFDNQVVVNDIVSIIDSNQQHLLFPWGQREPFFPYLTAALWKLLPGVGGVWIVRFSCTVIDLFAAWGIYLLGSTLRGRRLGLILMALWAVSLPMTIWNYFGMGQNTAALAAIVVLLFFVRLLQKPSFARFLYWGAALGFGGYCYVPFRPWTPSIISLVLIWALWGSKEKPKGAAPWALSAGLWVSWAFLFFYKNNYLPEKNGLVVLATSSVFLAFWALALLAAYALTWKAREDSGANFKVFGWATGAVLTVLIMSPLYLDPLYSQHTTQSSVFYGESGPLPLGAALGAMWHNIQFFVAVMFGQTHEEVGRYPIWNHSYFELFPELCMLIGLAYFLVRPTWMKMTVLLLFLVGATSLIFSNHPHTGRVETTVPPLLLLAGWGLEVFWESLKGQTPSRLFREVLLAGLIGFWILASHAGFEDVRGWMAFKSNDAKIGEQVDKDWEQYRVMISVHYPQFGTPALTVLCDQKEAYVLNDPNPIYLGPGEKGKDIVLLMYGASGSDTALENRVRTEFPQAQWSVIESPNPDIHRFMLRALIPVDALAETPGKLFYIQRVPGDYWRRRFYWKDYGVGRGIVWWDDQTPQLKAPFPLGMNEYVTGRADGVMQIPMDGDYYFSIKPTTDVIVLSIDGRKVIDVRPAPGTSLQARERIHLKAGTHTVSYVSTFRTLGNFQDVLVTPPDGSPGWVLGQGSPPTGTLHQP